MTETIQELMTPNPTALPATSTLADAARAMRDAHIGDVIVLDENEAVCGIVTDRDIVIRAIADGRDPRDASLGDICSRDVVTVPPTGSADDAVEIMRGKSLRRLPVVEGGLPVGIVSLGDLAVARDPQSALGRISAAAPNT